jgi:hypothetical protein
MVPYLERTLDLSREYSSYFAPYKHVADPHIDYADEGMTTASILKLFSELTSQLVPMVCTICEQPVADDSSLRQAFPEAPQFELALNVAEHLGYDLNRGRHGYGDVRDITSRWLVIETGRTIENANVGLVQNLRKLFGADEFAAHGSLNSYRLPEMNN